MTTQGMNVDQAVSERYSQASKIVEGALCCPTDYDPKYLKVIPKEVIEKDYGCGDPSQYLESGETVLDLGSGTGKICFIASQIVGSEGKVIGVDINDDMLSVARQAALSVGDQTGFHNVEFLKGKIQDLRLDREKLDNYLRESPITSEEGFRKLEAHVEKLGKEEPLIPDNSIDAVVSNCVLNLVSSQDKKQLFAELFRVLKKGGRAIISDIVSDEVVPEEMRSDAELWSGCLSGAFQEKEFLQAFEEAGFYGIKLEKRDEKPWQTIEGIEFRSVTVVAYKGKEGECWDHNEALVYKGPFKSVVDDDGHTFLRGERIAVCRKTFEIYQKQPYRDSFFSVTPRVPVHSSEAPLFSCEGIVRRLPQESKGDGYRDNTGKSDASCC